VNVQFSTAMLTRHIDIAILSICHVPVLYLNSLAYHHSCFLQRRPMVAPSLLFSRRGQVGYIISRFSTSIMEKDTRHYGTVIIYALSMTLSTFGGHVGDLDLLTIATCVRS